MTTRTPEPIKTETPAPTPENPNPDPVTTGGGNTTTTVHPGGGAAGGVPGGEPQVTKTTTNPDGSTVSTTAPLSTFCEQNPSSGLCKESDAGSFGGSCESGFTCEGDAAQCAIANKIHQDRCADRDQLNQYQDAIAKGDKILKGEIDEDVEGFFARGEGHSRTVELPTALSETGDANFGASGLTDLTVSVIGQAVVIPFSKLNQILQILGYVLLALSYLAALRIVGIF